MGSKSTFPLCQSCDSGDCWCRMILINYQTTKQHSTTSCWWFCLDKNWKKKRVKWKLVKNNGADMCRPDTFFVCLRVCDCSTSHCCSHPLCCNRNEKSRETQHRIGKNKSYCPFLSCDSGLLDMAAQTAEGEHGLMETLRKTVATVEKSDSAIYQVLRLKPDHTVLWICSVLQSVLCKHSPL